MPRAKRVCPAGEVFHVLNRSVARLALFAKPDDYDAFVRVIDETWQLVPLPIFALAVMPNHWHFVVRPTDDGQVSDFFRRLALTHTMRWHAHHGTSGTGHLYQGRFKSFPVATDDYLLSVIRYVERNPLRSGLCEAAEAWRWSSAWYRAQPRRLRPSWLTDPSDPPLPRLWRQWVNEPQTEAEVASIAHSIRRGTPLGDSTWQQTSATRLGLENTLRRRGRPGKGS